MGWHNLYSLNVFRARLEGVDNETLVKLCLDNANDIWNIGLEEALNNGIIIIEWPEIIEEILPKSKIIISLTETNNNIRKAKIFANNIFLNKF